MIHLRRSLGAVVLALVVASCSSPAKVATPVPQGPDSESSETAPAPKVRVDTPELVAAKRAAGIEDCPAPASVEPAEDLPNITVACLGGGRDVNLATLTGRPMVINVWASWCKPCREELPLLARAHAEFGDRVQFIGLDFADKSPEAAIELAKSSGVTYPLVADPASKTKVALKVVGLPQTVYVNTDGSVEAVERVAYRSYEDLLSDLDRHLGVS